MGYLNGKASFPANGPVLLGIGFVPVLSCEVLTLQIPQLAWLLRESLQYAKDLLRMHNREAGLESQSSGVVVERYKKFQVGEVDPDQALRSYPARLRT